MIKPTSFYSVLSPLFYISKLIGLTPFSVGSRYKRTKSSIFCSFLFLLIELTSTVIILSEELSGFEELSFTAIPGLVNIILNPLCVCLFVLFQLLHCNKLVGIISSIDLFDQEMKTFLKVDLLKEYRRNKIVVIVFSAGSIFWNIMSCSYTIIIDKTQFGFFKSFIIYVFPSGIISFMCLQCCLMTLFLTKRFSWINEKFVQTTSRIEKRIPKVKRQLGTLETDNNDVTLINNVAFVIETCRTKHYQLCQISNEVNSIYSMQILLIIFKDFVVITTGLFFNGRMLMYLGYILPDYAIYSVIQLGLPIIQLLALTIICSSISYEASRTGCLIYNLIKNLRQRENNLKTQITFFALQILHQPVKFTACKLFAINENLLLTIVGAISTYLVIVIQFQIGDEPIN